MIPSTITHSKLRDMVDSLQTTHSSLYNKLKSLYEKYLNASGEEKDMLDLSLLMSTLYRVV